MRGLVTLVFDDGYEAIFQHVVPLLNQLKMPGVFAIPLNAPYPWQRWLTIRERGHEIAGHSMTHRDFTTLTPEELERELLEPAQQLGAKTLVYPGGAHNDEVIRAARNYYTAARTVRRGFESLPPSDPFRLKTINWSKRNFSLTKANLFVFWAWLSNTWLIETYHQIDDHQRDMLHTVSMRDFSEHVKFIKRLPIAVKTIYDVIHSS